MSKTSYRRGGQKRLGVSQRILLGVGVVLLLGAVGYAVFINDNFVSAPAPAAKAVKPVAKEPSKPAYTAIDLQPTVDAWIAKQSADYHIVVYDAQAKKAIASNLPDESLFAASLYKIYVAYLALQDIQDGSMKADEVISDSFTRKECIDKMIRESYSPCGEAMMADMGPATLNKRVKELGMTGTTFNGIATSAHDSALILQYIDQGKDLNATNTAFLRDAMLTQPAMYKRGLQLGAPDAKWETKVGWNEDQNYHDIGIMTLPDKRVFYVAILSQGNGSSKPVADFAKTIYAKLTE